MTDDTHSAAGADPGDGSATNPPRPTLAEAGAEAIDELVRVTEEDQGAPFAVIRDLALLKRADRAKFESLRSRLRDARCRVTELDKLVAEESGEVPSAGGDMSDADVLVGLAEAADLFQDASEVAYADIEVNGHRETWPIRSHGFRRWLRRLFHEATGGAPSSEGLNAALNVVEAKAQHDTLVREVHVRVGGLGGKLYLDKCDPQWRAIEMDEACWRIVERPVIRFLRSPDMRPLPDPEESGSVEGLRRLLNIPEGAEGDNDFILAIAWVLACLRGRGPYPVMAIGGEQGTAKSTRSALLRSLIDPGRPTLRALPRDERDLVVAARSRHVLAFDNVSDLRWWLSDALCRIASGAGFGTRQLYTDVDEVTFEGARPLILNGIEDVVERPDLAERTIFSICQLIDGSRRLSEDEIWASFDASHASILGALLDAVVEGLKRFSDTRPPDLPRMADFAHWAVACEPALWGTGDFMGAYNANILGAVESVLEASHVAVAVRVLMANLKAVQQTQWTGTSTELLAKLTPLVDERITKTNEWPRTGRGLSGQLRRAASFLRRVGIHIAFHREAHTGVRKVTITADIYPRGRKNSPGDASFASPSSSSGAGGDGDDAKEASPANAAGSGGYTCTKSALDVCCCRWRRSAGFAARGFTVTGIDIELQPHHCGDRFILGNAIEFLEKVDFSQFDLNWASPPCQAYGVLRHAPGKHRKVDLIGPTRELLIRSGLPYIIENVEGAKDRLINPVRLCGSLFGLESPGWHVERHRLFETSLPLAALRAAPYKQPVVSAIRGHFHDRQRDKGENHRSHLAVPSEHGFAAHGVDWPMTVVDTCESIPCSVSEVSFAVWIRTTAITDDAVGDFVGDARRDRTFPKWLRNPARLNRISVDGALAKAPSTAGITHLRCAEHGAESQATRSGNCACSSRLCLALVVHGRQLHRVAARAYGTPGSPSRRCSAKPCNQDRPPLFRELRALNPQQHVA
jgi:hypothetical protein